MNRLVSFQEIRKISSLNGKSTLKVNQTYLDVLICWQYRLWSFKFEDTKLDG